MEMDIPDNGQPGLISCRDVPPLDWVSIALMRKCRHRHRHRRSLGEKNYRFSAEIDNFTNCNRKNEKTPMRAHKIDFDKRIKGVT